MATKCCFPFCDKLTCFSFLRDCQPNAQIWIIILGLYRLIFQVKMMFWEKELLVQFITTTITKTLKSQLFYFNIQQTCLYEYIPFHQISQSLRSWNLIKLKMFTCSLMTLFSETLFFFKCVKVSNTSIFWCHWFVSS